MNITKNLTKEQKGFLYKTCFFVVLLVVIALMYLESKLLIDAVYFLIILATFVRFLILKLYHLWYNFFGDIYVNRYSLSRFKKWIW